MGQGAEAVGEPCSRLGDALRRYPVRRADDLEDIVATQPIVRGGDDHVEPRRAQARVLGLDHEGVPMGSAAHR